MIFDAHFFKTDVVYFVSKKTGLFSLQHYQVKWQFVLCFGAHSYNHTARVHCGSLVLQLTIIKRSYGTSSRCREQSRTRYWRTQLAAKSIRFNGAALNQTGLPSVTAVASKYCVYDTRPWPYVLCVCSLCRWFIYTLVCTGF